MDVRVPFGYVTPPTGWRAYARDAAIVLLIAACSAPNVVNADGMEVRHRAHYGHGCGFRRTLLQGWRILHARMPVRFMHYPNVSPRTLGDPAGHLPGRLGLLAVC